MSISLMLDEMKRNVERVREEEGDEAAERFEREQSHGVIGGHFAGAGGALGGAAIGSMILPGVGTVIGGIAGLIFGITQGVKDKSTFDNVKTGIGAVSAFRKNT